MERGGAACAERGGARAVVSGRGRQGGSHQRVTPAALLPDGLDGLDGPGGPGGLDGPGGTGLRPGRLPCRRGGRRQSEGGEFVTLPAQ